MEWLKKMVKSIQKV